MSSSKWHGGKGSKRRPEDVKKYEDSYDKIFGVKCPECGMRAGQHKMSCDSGYDEKNSEKNEII